jgi:hypothetical protein
MQLTVCVASLACLIGLLCPSRRGAAAAIFCGVVLMHLAIEMGPALYKISASARVTALTLAKIGRDPSSAAPVMLAAGAIGWFLSMLVKTIFLETPARDWDPDRPGALKGRRHA